LKLNQRAGIRFLRHKFRRERATRLMRLTESDQKEEPVMVIEGEEVGEEE
jgi:hypothetical protein